jgi:hypothetical protein
LVGKPLLHFVARQGTRDFRRRVSTLRLDAFGPDVVLLRPRHGRPADMLLTARRIRSTNSFVWIVLPEARVA